MKAMIFRDHGGPEQFRLVEMPAPDPMPGTVVIRVKAFGLNRAETYMRRGLWGEVAAITGIECVGTVEHDPDGRFAKGQTVIALMGGMGRTINGSYAEFTRVPASNVAAIATSLPWSELAAIPESYATAWCSLHNNLRIEAGQTLLVRGATSALGQAAINIARHADVRVIATTRNAASAALLESLGATAVLREQDDVDAKVRQSWPGGVDAVLDLVGNSTLQGSLKAARHYGKVCIAGFLGGLAPLPAFDPLHDMPTGVQLSLFASYMLGTPGFALADIPLQDIVACVERGVFHAKPARVFPFEAIPAAHRLIESNAARGKLVVTLD
jgi:NADPH:quinone reductase-like Zn-dependent oxidoreductase